MRDDSPLHLSRHVFSGLDDGPSLLILGAVHGNESCGTQAIEQLLAALTDGSVVIRRGTLTLVPVTNPLAYRQRTREGQRNLNRHLGPVEQPVDFEDQVANWLCPLLAQHDVLLDLHSFHTPGEPFVMLGPANNNGTLEPFSSAEPERRMAACLGVRRFVDGWLSTYAKGAQRRGDHQANAAGVDYGVGTAEYMRRVGGYGVTLECGQHDDPAAVEVASQAIFNTLALLGFIDAHQPPVTPEIENMHIVDVVDKTHDDDRFTRLWNSFDSFRCGDCIGTRNDGTPVLAEYDARILFPNPDARAGREWFYLARPAT